MFYQDTFTVPAQTPEETPLIRRLVLTKGIIKNILVGFPPGACALCHVQIYDKGWQLVPWTPGESLAWDDYVFDLLLNYPLVAEPYELVILAWNDDDSYEHSIFVGMNMEEGEVDTAFIEFFRALKEAM